MKVLQVHVGNEVIPDPSRSPDYYLQRVSFHDGSLKYYTKWDIITVDKQINSIKALGVDVVYGHVSDRKSIGALWRAGMRLRKLCRQEQVDIVHAYWGSTTALMTALFSPKPVILSFAGSDLLGNVDANGKIILNGRVSRFCSQLASIIATRIITKSEHMRQSLWPVSRAKTVAIPDGINLDKFEPMAVDEARARLGWEKDAQVVLFFDGGGAIVKDRPLAERAMAVVKKEFPAAQLFIAKGIVHEELPLYYNASNALLLTSYHEGSNNSLKEARACNVPVVAVNVGDAKERLQGVSNSYVIDSRDANELGTKLIGILSQDKVRSNGAAVSGDVSMESVARQIVDVYNQVMNK